MQKTISSSEIAAKLASLDAALEQASAEFDSLSSDAVAGVEGAGTKASAAHGRIERLNVERRILERAQAKAFKREAEVKAAVEAEARAKHVDQARKTVAKLISQAELVDDLTGQLAAAVADLDRLEGQVRSSLAAARQLPGDGVVGRKGISVFALDRLNALATGTLNRVSNPRTVADIARVAWIYLFNSDDDKEAA